ncbi:MAG TPA: S8 family serine peptidase, partial [Mycobacterium sp.]|nr:S8 family serine peptidase [Mycobacterium sp.]
MLLGAIDASAQGRRARLSRDLAQQLESVTDTATCVIVPGTRAQLDGLASRHGLTIRKRLKAGAVVEIPAGALAAVAADAGLDSLTSNYRLQPHMAVTTAAIGADQVWSTGWVAGAPGLTGSGIGVAVIDTGVAAVPELKNRIVVSVDFTGSSGASGQAVGRAGCGGAGTAVRGRADDDNGHGTHVAGIIAAAGVNAKDTTSGLAPGAHIINLKVLGADGSGYASDVAEAIDWAVENRDRYKIKVINLSLG